jgi:hypothetical protein
LIDCTFAIAGLSIPWRQICCDIVIGAVSRRCRGVPAFLSALPQLAKKISFLISQKRWLPLCVPEVGLKGIISLMESGWRKSLPFVADWVSARIQVVRMKIASMEGAIE